MSFDPVSMGAGAAFELATLIAEKIADATGLERAKTYEVAIEVARSWVANERRAVTAARAEAKARVAARKSKG